MLYMHTQKIESVVFALKHKELSGCKFFLPPNIIGNSQPTTNKNTRHVFVYSVSVPLGLFLGKSLLRLDLSCDI